MALNLDYFSVSADDLKKIRSVLTVVDGDVVYDDLRGGHHPTGEGLGRARCRGGPDGVQPLLDGGRRVIVDGHPICGKCGGAVEPRAG